MEWYTGLYFKVLLILSLLKTVSFFYLRIALKEGERVRPSHLVSGCKIRNQLARMCVYTGK